MIKKMEDAERDTALRVADLMAAAARTAPKASGKDKVVTVIVTGDDMMALADETEKAGREYGEDFFIRDANNVRNSHCVVVIGVVSEPFGIGNCGMCGFKNCAEMKKAGANCAFNVSDLGIAVGSAVSVAADHRIDNRVMFSVGRGAVRMGLFPEDVRVAYAIPLYTGSKSIYFDRNPGAVLR